MQLLNLRHPGTRPAVTAVHKRRRDTGEYHVIVVKALKLELEPEHKIFSVAVQISWFQFPVSYRFLSVPSSA